MSVKTKRRSSKGKDKSGVSGARPAAAQTVKAAKPQRSLLLRGMMPWVGLGILLAGYIALFIWASFIKYDNFGQGFDQVDFELALWNFTQGRGFEDLRFNFTNSIFGIDFMPILYLLVPFYALFPSAHTLIVLQTIILASGAVPVFLLAKEKLGKPNWGLVFSILYLVYPTVEYINMSPIQMRAFAIAFLLYAFYFFYNRRWIPAAVFSVLALLCRTDVALVIIMFGLFELVTQRNWRYVATPAIVGFAWFAVSLFVIVPSFTHPAPPVDVSTLPFTEPGMKTDWLTGNNSLLTYYDHFGTSPGEIVSNIITKPLDTLSVMFTREKLLYLFMLLIPLGLLPLVGWEGLLLVLPIVLMNLLSDRSSQFDFRTQYSALLVPGLIVASIWGVQRWLKAIDHIGRRGTLPFKGTAPLMSLLVIVAFEANTMLHNPVLSTMRYHETAERVQAANSLIHMMPRDASVAASSFLAPRTLPRRYVYNFPPQSYTPSLEKVNYILVDPNASMLKERTSLDQLKASPDWRLVAEKEGYMLFQNKKYPGPER